MREKKRMARTKQDWQDEIEANLIETYAIIEVRTLGCLLDTLDEAIQLACAVDEYSLTPENLSISSGRGKILCRQTICDESRSRPEDRFGILRSVHW